MKKSNQKAEKNLNQAQEAKNPTSFTRLKKPKKPFSWISLRSIFCLSITLLVQPLWHIQGDRPPRTEADSISPLYNIRAQSTCLGQSTENKDNNKHLDLMANESNVSF